MFFDARRPSLAGFRHRIRRILPSLATRTCLSIVIVAMTVPRDVRADEPQTWKLALQPKANDCTTYRAILEVDGKVKWKNKDGEKHAPLSIRGDLTFDERLLNADSAENNFRSARYYRNATVEYQLGKQNNKRQLSEQQRLLVASLQDGKPAIASPTEPLSQDELDLVDVPGCTLALWQLLPAEEISAGASWELPSEALPPLLGITSVTSSEVQASLARVENDVALITFKGSVHGRSDGSSTEMQVEGKLNVDVNQKSITWLAMSIQEVREVSDTQPGLEVTARLRLAAKPSLDPIAELADDSLPEVLQQEDSLTELVRIVSSEAGFELLADRQWRVIVDRHDGMILRCFDDDQLIAQAIISPLPDGPPGKHLTMQALEEDVQEILQKHAGQIVERAEGAGENGVRVLRISAAGVVSEVSMQWVYYHLSNDQGRRAGLTFTVQTDLIEKLAQRDQAMVENFRFLPIAGTTPVNTTQPTSTKVNPD